MARIESHERVCAERYTIIAETLTGLRADMASQSVTLAAALLQTTQIATSALTKIEEHEKLCKGRCDSIEVSVEKLADRMDVTLREFRMALQKMASAESNRWLKISVTVILGLCGIVGVLLGTIWHFYSNT